MPKTQIRAVAEAAFFQCVVYDSKSRKRSIVVYACGSDVYFANDFFGLFDRDRVHVAPKWLKDQLANLPADVARLDWRGATVGGASVQALAAAAAESRVPTLRVPEGEGLGDGEEGIQQARG